MRPPYVSIRARFITICFALLTVSTVVLVAASYSMSQRILIKMKEVNLDLVTTMKQAQASEMLVSMSKQLIRTTVSDPIQTIVLYNLTTIDSTKVSLLEETMQSHEMLAIKIYNRTLHEQYSLALDPILPDFSNVPAGVLPDTGNNTYSAVWTDVNVTGISVGGPAPLGSTNGTYVMSFSIPVVSITAANLGLDTQPQDLIGLTIVGYVTVIYDCSSLQTFLKETPLNDSNGRSEAVICLLDEDQPRVQLMLPYLSAGAPLWFEFGEYANIPRSMWRTLLNDKSVLAQNSGYNNGLVSISTLSFQSGLRYVIASWQPGKSVRADIIAFMHDLIIAICVIEAVMFVAFFLLLRWITRNLLRLISATSKRKRALDVSQGRRIPTMSETSDDDIDSSGTAVSTSSNWKAFHKGSTSKLGFWRGMRMLKSQEKKSDDTAPSLKPNNSLVVDVEKQSTNTIGNFDKRHPLYFQLSDECVDMAIRIDSIFQALSRQYKILEERVEIRKKEIQEAQRNADEANAAKTHFLARVTHELRTPLNGILGTATLCMDEEDITSVRTSLKTIYKCGELLLHLLTDLLTFTESELETDALDEREFMLDEVTVQIWAIFRDQTEKANINLDISIGPDSKALIVYGDLNRILQVVFNLMSNSLKFTPANGRVEFKVTSEEIEDGAERLVTFVVRDNGPGIAPHLQARVFEAFVQGEIDNTRVRKAGVGLGLNICEELAKRMGGSISLKSELGHGAEFTFKLPLRYVSTKRNSSRGITNENQKNLWPEYELYNTDTIMKKAEAELGVSKKISSGINSGVTTPKSEKKSFNADHSDADTKKEESIPDLPTLHGFEGNNDDQARPPLNRAPTASSAPVDTALRVLVADDNKVNQEIMKRMLNLEGLADIEVADDGLEAIEKAKLAADDGKLFDIIFMDVQMPNCDGKKATQTLRELKFSVPIIAVSAYANEENVEACLSAGMNLFLGKPLRRPSLHKLLQGLHEFTTRA